MNLVLCFENWRHSVKVKVKESKDDWTKKELTLRLGIGELAKAIIEQWHKDGEPEKDREAIDAWFKIAQLYN